MESTLVSQLTNLQLAEQTESTPPVAKPAKDGRVCRYYANSKPCPAGAKCQFSHDLERARLNPKKQRSSHKGKNAKKNQAVNRKKDYIDMFFAGYPTFKYRPTAPVWNEFRRMCEEFGWSTRSQEEACDEKKVAEKEFKKALVDQFNDMYGKSAYSLGSLRKLCHVLGVDPMPTTVEECRERIRSSHVNLVDLVDSPRTGDPVEIFPTLQALQEYTRDTRKFFPKEDAYGSLLQFLLREISGLYQGRTRLPMAVGGCQAEKV